MTAIKNQIKLKLLDTSQRMRIHRHQNLHFEQASRAGAVSSTYHWTGVFGSCILNAIIGHYKMEMWVSCICKWRNSILLHLHRNHPRYGRFSKHWQQCECSKWNDSWLFAQAIPTAVANSENSNWLLSTWEFMDRKRRELLPLRQAWKKKSAKKSKSVESWTQENEIKIVERRKKHAKQKKIT